MAWTEEEKNTITWTISEYGSWFQAGWFEGWFQKLVQLEITWTEEDKDSITWTQS